MKRRDFLSGAAAVAGLALTRPAFARKSGATALSHKERIDKALLGQEVDRPPYTFYYHYAKPTAQLEAEARRLGVWKLLPKSESQALLSAVRDLLNPEMEVRLAS